MKYAGSTLAYLSVNQAEKELQETNAKLKLLTASQTDGITIRTIFSMILFLWVFLLLLLLVHEIDLHFLLIIDEMYMRRDREMMGNNINVT